MTSIPSPSVIDAVELREDDADPFSVLERQLRETEEQRPLESRESRQDEREQRVMAELEDWLSAIAIDRDQRPSA